MAFILEGSVRRSEDNLRVTVQLIKAENDEHIWSETLDKPMSEIFQVQRDIATQLASYFRITLTESDKGSLNQIPTKFISAYDYYLRANEMSGQRSIENNQAIELLKKAIVIDPQFSEAMARLSFCYAKKGIDLMEGENWLDTANTYARRALVISPESAHVNSRLGFVLMYQGKDSSAIRFLRKAYRSGSTLGLRPLANICFRKGMADSAYYYAKLLVSRDPLAGGYSSLIHIFTELGEEDSARHYLDTGLEKGGSATSNDIMHLEAVEFFINFGKYDEGLQYISETLAKSNDPAIIKEVSDFRKRIISLKRDWQKLPDLLTGEDPEWEALMYKNMGDKIGYEKIILQVNKKRPSDHFLLLKNDIKGIIDELEARSPERRYTTYQRWLRDPFAQEFINTPAFKDLFRGYEPWSKEMMASIKRISESNQ